MRDHNQHKYKGVFTGFLHQLLLLDLVRYGVAYVRYFYFVKLRKKLRTYASSHKGVGANTIFHNLKGLKDLAVVRSLALIKPLSVIESLGKDAQILTIGPRTEGEILSLIGYGFMPGNIRGLDLITYSPWIDLGDMHAMPYQDNSFDAVVMGWVIAYSEDPHQAASEVLRVIKNGGIVAVGIEFGGKGIEEKISELGYRPGAERVTSQVEQVLEYFEHHVDHVYFSHSIIPQRSDMKGSVIAIFSVKK